MAPADLDLAAIWLTLRLAVTATALLLVLGTPLAWWLARTGSWLRGPVGALTQALGLGLLPFTFAGLVVASVLYSLPFVVQPLQASFEAIGDRPLEAAATLRAGPLDRFLTVALPLAWPVVLSATILGFAHTVGEFGVVLMIGGNIPGQTKVLSVALYDHVEALEYAHAHWLAGGMLLFSFLVLLVVYTWGRRPRVAL